MLQVILNKDHKEMLILPKEEFEAFAEQIRAGKDLKSLLKNAPSKSVVDMSAQELEAYLMPETERLVLEPLKKGLYASIWLDKTGIEGQFIHHYADGKTETIQVDAKTGKERILKTNR